MIRELKSPDSGNYKRKDIVGKDSDTKMDRY